ncbi:MAG: hypothetical protein M5U19_09675 [Microthrixaceae bacterium]|nr:hypothetical protein [Microthrixaceae bacterium]
MNWPNGSRPSGENVGRIRLSGLKSPYDPPLPTEELDAAGLLLTSLSYYGNHDDAYTNVVVRKADLTAICGAGFKRIGANGHTRYLDLMTTDTNQASTLSGYSRCSSALTSAMQLENAVIDIEVKAKCSSIIPGLICGWGFVNAWIELTHASVITVSSFEEPAPAGRPVMRVTVNDDAGAGDDALFNVFGTVSLPRTALDVFWKGPAPTRAIVEGDDLVVAAIGSFGTGADHEVGVLCCGPVKLKDRKVQLRAIVDVPGEGERLRSEATVTIHDEDESAGTYSAGSRVTTDDYRICNTADVDDPVGCGHTSP